MTNTLIVASEAGATQEIERADQPRGRPFLPGQSGNRNGRPKGSRNKATLAMEALLDGEAEAITQKLVDLAKDGDSASIRMCVDRLLPTRRHRLVEFDLPPIETSADARKASSAVLAACAAGHISIAEAQEFQSMITTHLTLIDISNTDTMVRESRQV